MKTNAARCAPRFISFTHSKFACNSELSRWSKCVFTPSALLRRYDPKLARRMYVYASTSLCTHLHTRRLPFQVLLVFGVHYTIKPFICLAAWRLDMRHTNTAAIKAHPRAPQRNVYFRFSFGFPSRSDRRWNIS